MKKDSYAVMKADEQTKRFAAQANSVQAMENMETAPKSLESVMQLQQAWSQARTAEEALERIGGLQASAEQSETVSFTK